MPFSNPGADEIRALLHSVKTIAVVGLSPDPDRPSYSVAMYLQTQGYRIVSNMGGHGGQEVPHLHVHLFGGAAMGTMIARAGK